MTKFLDYLTKVARPQHDEDMIDRANNRITVVLFLTAGLSIFAKEYYGDPIRCWGKAQWQDSWLHYAQAFCFVEGTFFLPLNETYPNVHEFDNHGKKVNFYQWIPFILYLMGGIMLIPRFFWTFINSSSYLHMNVILEMSGKSKDKILPEKTQVKSCAIHMVKAFNSKAYVIKKKRYPTFGNVFHAKSARDFKDKLVDWWCHRYSSPSFLSTFFIIFKMINITTVFLVLVLMNNLVADEEGTIVGYKLISDLINGKPWEESGVFARVTVCKFDIREVDNQNNYTEIVPKITQCVLVAQMLAEKCYIVIIYWLFILQILNILNLIQWIWSTLACQKRKFLKNVLESSMRFNFPDIHQNPKYKNRIQKLREANIIKRLAYDEILEEGCDHKDKKAYIEKLELAYQEFVAANSEYIAKLKYWEEKRQTEIEAYKTALDKRFEDFVRFIGSDGLLIIRMLYTNTGAQTAGNITSKLFEKYYEQCIYREKRHKILSSIDQNGNITKNNQVIFRQSKTFTENPESDYTEPIGHIYDVPHFTHPMQVPV